MEIWNLPCKLTDQELDERRDKVVALISKSDELEAEKKSEATRLKTEIEEVNSNIRGIAVEIRERSQRRPVQVKREKDFGRRVEEVIRVDTGEVVETRALTPAEMQGELVLIGGEQEAAL